MKKCVYLISILLIIMSMSFLAGCATKKESISDEDLQMLREMKEELEAEKEQIIDEKVDKEKINDETEILNDNEVEEEIEELNEDSDNYSEKMISSLETLDYSERDNLNTFYNGVACVAVGGSRYLIDKEGNAKCNINKIIGGTYRDIHIVPVNCSGLWVAYDSSRKFVVFDSEGNEKYRNEDENCRFLGAADDCIFYAKLESGFDESKVSVIKIDTSISESEVAMFVDAEGDAIDSLNTIDKKSKQACIFHKLDDGVYYEDKMGFVNENTKTAFCHRDYNYVGINSKNMYVFVDGGIDALYECMPVSSNLKSVKCGDDVNALIYNESNQNWGDFYKARIVDNGYVGFNLYENDVFSMDGNRITLPVSIDEGTSFTQYTNDRIGVGCYGQDDNPYLLIVDGQGNRVCEPIQTEYILYGIANVNGFILGIGNELIGVTQDGNVIRIDDGFPIDESYRCDLLGIAEGFIWHDASKSFVSYDGKTVIDKIRVAE